MNSTETFLWLALCIAGALIGIFSPLVYFGGSLAGFAAAALCFKDN